MEQEMSSFYIKAEAVRADSCCGTGTKCGRWNPTMEQVKVLTELFQSGLRTPSTAQIQKISYQLSFYGKIKSKNVFYWFQNHKARERQKRRKVSLDDNDSLICHEDNLPSKRILEINHDDQRDQRVIIETLQLFPLNSFNEMEDEKQLRSEFLQANEYYLMEKVEIDYPPLDLRLSFI